ncbi:hypothetical protein JCM3775_006763 [Rhodotorula graminis]
MFSNSGAGDGGPPVGGPHARAHPVGPLPTHPHRATYGQQPQQQYPQYAPGPPQGYAVQQAAPHQQQVRAMPGQHPSGPPGSYAHGPGASPTVYGDENYGAGYDVEARHGPVSQYAAPSPHMVARGRAPQPTPRQQPPPLQQQQQQQHFLAPGQASYGAHAPPPDRSPAPPAASLPLYVQQSPTTYAPAPPRPLSSSHYPHPHAGPSPHLRPQQAPAPSHAALGHGPSPHPPPQHPRSAQAAPRVYQQHQASSPHPSTQLPSPMSAYPPQQHPQQQARRPSFVHTASQPSPSLRAAVPPPNTHAAAQAHAQAQAQADARAQAQAQAHVNAHAERARVARAARLAAADAQAQAQVRRAREAAEADEADVVPASRPLRTTGNGYVVAPVQAVGGGGAQAYAQVQAVPQGQGQAQAQVPRVEVDALLLEDDTEQRTQFHAYLLDYLQKAGFISTAAALLADVPSIPTQPLSTGRSFAVPSTTPSSSQPRSAASTSFPRDAHDPNTPFSTSPSALSPAPSGSGPPPPPPRGRGDRNPSPQRRRDGSPGSPASSQGGDDGYGGKNNADTVESTASAASTTSHFGFDALDPGHGGGGGGGSSGGASASPAKDGARSPSKRLVAPPSRNVSASSSTGAADSQQPHSQPDRVRRIPAAQVQIDAPTGFLFEWWSVFWDVFRAQAAARRPGAVDNGANARSFCQASSAAVDAAMLRRSSALRPGPTLGAPGAAAVATSSPAFGLGRMPPNMQAQHQGPPPPLPLVAPVGAGPAAGLGGRQPIPLRTAPLGGRQTVVQQPQASMSQPQAAQQPSPAQQQQQHGAGAGAASARPSSRASGRRGAVLPDALADEALPPPGPPDDVRRPSSSSGPQAAQLAKQRRDEQQAEIDMRMAQARVHAQQITSRQRTQSGASPSVAGGTPESLAAAAASPGLAQPTPPSSAFSPGALNYNPNQLQQTIEARKTYRAQLLLSQQTQLEQAKRSATALPRSTSASAVAAAAAAAASVPTPSATPQAHEGEGSMPPPTRTLSLNSTPVVKELALGPSPSRAGAAGAPPDADAPPVSATAKRRRESLEVSVSEARETKKRSTKVDGGGDARAATRSDALEPESAVEARADLVLVHDFAMLPSSSKEAAPVVSADELVIVDSSAALDVGSAAGFDAKELLFDPSTRPVDDLAGQFSLEQLDALLSSTVHSAGPPFPTDDVPVLDVAPFDYEEFMISFGNEGPASYDPTQGFDLAV